MTSRIWKLPTDASSRFNKFYFCYVVILPQLFPVLSFAVVPKPVEVATPYAIAGHDQRGRVRGGGGERPLLDL